MSGRRQVRAVVFDIGETLVDESRHWATWADWLGVSHLTFFGALGVIIERREPHTRVFELLRPGLDLAEERERRRRAGIVDAWLAQDLYPDARSGLEALRRAGYRTGAVGNQYRWGSDSLARLDLPLDFVASSEGWGVAKPDPGFFARIAVETGLPAAALAYVGDRLDNDVLPARKAGLCGVFLRRGPWGIAHAQWPEAREVDLVIDRLDALPGALENWMAR